MKKFLIGFAFLALSFLARTQESGQTFKPFKADIAFGYAIPGGSGSKGGIIFALEPKYAISDLISLGLRLESAIMARAYRDANGSYVVGDLKASSSYLATADYYFTTQDFRPFVGAGLGLYRLASISDLNSSSGSTIIEAGNKFGFMPRVGFEFRHFRMAVEYNVPGKTGTVNNNYLGIKIGFFVGGGRLQ